MKTSGTDPKQGRKERAQKYCQYVIDPETEKTCGEQLLGKGRESQGRRKYCVAHSELADKESRKQNGSLWVRNHRTRQPDSSRFSDNIRKTKKEILDFLSSSLLVDYMREFYEYCFDNSKEIGQWFRYELNFAHTAFEIGYPNVTSIAVTEKQTSLYAITLESCSGAYASLLPPRSCSPEYHSEYHFINRSNKARCAINSKRFNEIYVKETKQFERSIRVSFRSNSLFHKLTITQYDKNHFPSVDDLYNNYTMSCWTDYPLYFIISQRGIIDKNRIVIVTTSIPPYGLTGCGFGEVGDDITSNFMIEDYKNPPLYNYYYNYNGFCLLSFPDLYYPNHGFRYAWPCTILYRGEEIVVGGKRQGKKKTPKKK